MSTNPSLIISAAHTWQFPDPSLPEIVFVGRSNVGKSSLINHLTGVKKQAKVSSTPGKTQLINFFSYSPYTFVDLPGYGFAKVSKSLREKWGKLIHTYLETRQNIGLIILLIDLRHSPSQDDMVFAEWASTKNVPIIVIYTKSDKLSLALQKQQEIKNTLLLQKVFQETKVSYIPYSIKSTKARMILKKEIEKTVAIKAIR
jgi:GTP-binding protein